MRVPVKLVPPAILFTVSCALSSVSIFMGTENTQGFQTPLSVTFPDEDENSARMYPYSSGDKDVVSLVLPHLISAVSIPSGFPPKPIL